MTTSRRKGDLLLWASLAGSVAVLALTVLALRMVPPPGVPAGAGPVLPRMRGPSGPLAPGSALRALGVGSLTWYVSILAAPLFVWLSRRLPLERGRWVGSAAAWAVVVGVLVLTTAWMQYRFAYGGSPLAPPMADYLKFTALTGILPFLAVAAVAQALDARARAHERALETAHARGQLAEARLEALTAQLQPHFLFNTLQGISTLIRSDPEAADRMLARLSDLLRDVLRHGERKEVPLREELDILAAYLDIARWRFGGRLALEVEVQEDAGHGLVPFFVLQPLVENALRHGVERRSGSGRVEIHAAREGGRLVLGVSNDGHLNDEQDFRQSPEGGVGLSNTRARLTELYGPDHVFEAGPREGGGYRVRIAIPYRRAPEDG